MNLDLFCLHPASTLQLDTLWHPTGESGEGTSCFAPTADHGFCRPDANTSLLLCFAGLPLPRGDMVVYFCEVAVIALLTEERPQDSDRLEWAQAFQN